MDSSKYRKMKKAGHNTDAAKKRKVLNFDSEFLKKYKKEKRKGIDHRFLQSNETRGSFHNPIIDGGLNFGPPDAMMSRSG